METKKKLNIPYPIVVEGKYDKLRVSCVCNATILTTEGFGIFKKQEKLSLLRSLSEKTPIIVLTDSDGAGKLIRSHITSAVDNSRLIQLYIPRIEGKEKRKEKASAEGTLGVEGMEQKLLYDLLSPFEDEGAATRLAENPLSKTDLYIDGLTGAPDSAARRAELSEKLKLPPDMTPNAMLAALRILLSYEEYLNVVGRAKE